MLSEIVIIMAAIVACLAYRETLRQAGNEKKFLAALEALEENDKRLAKGMIELLELCTVHENQLDAQKILNRALVDADKEIIDIIHKAAEMTGTPLREPDGRVN